MQGDDIAFRHWTECMDPPYGWKEERRYKATKTWHYEEPSNTGGPHPKCMILVRNS